ncbi:3-oxo-5-alpha-steroid 4-dehydrogenase family protein [Aspergillus saccharolyticus JOP 1030-1]|uniref:Uncharacterized protein n=1 Tax=Aspergillus saccharolyticus JOP 1030-1 TaxID=1450539 RepID=A0A318ZKS7_9EURO|nr:hypothetical protein BP01DRAFT_336053 [Aspergillus saccharolyticus JOP 1030-1]PYH47467.1 hypothetical protein BP01DRAFT_336053 [Aspergillus saccharolyticus JOP 1030-1]
MGATISTCWGNLPPLMDILLPTPDVYLTLLNIFQYFPLFTILQWLTAWHPAGKTSMKASIFNLPGRWAWCAMEIVSPINLIYILWKLPAKLQLHGTSPSSFALPLPNKIVAALFVLHYLNRAIISPFFAAPSMSPIHVFIMTSAMLFNWFNSTCLAGWLVGFEIPVQPENAGSVSTTAAAAAAAAAAGGQPTPFLTVSTALGLALFFAGMAGNIYAERTLFRLRREEAARRAAQPKSDADTPARSTSTSTEKVYIIPPPSTPLFSSILYPHYVSEWIEWAGFALVGTAVVQSGATAATVLGLRAGAGAGAGIGIGAASGSITPLHLAPWLRPAAHLAAWLRQPFPVPAVVFVINAVTNMLPHARWGRKWYVEKFGEKPLAGRGAVVPYCTWL